MAFKYGPIAAVVNIFFELSEQTLWPSFCPLAIKVPVYFRGKFTGLRSLLAIVMNMESVRQAHAVPKAHYAVKKANGPLARGGSVISAVTAT